MKLYEDLLDDIELETDSDVVPQLNNNTDVDTEQFDFILSIVVCVKGQHKLFTDFLDNIDRQFKLLTEKLDVFTDSFWTDGCIYYVKEDFEKDHTIEKFNEHKNLKFKEYSKNINYSSEEPIYKHAANILDEHTQAAYFVYFNLDNNIFHLFHLLDLFEGPFNDVTLNIEPTLFYYCILNNKYIGTGFDITDKIFPREQKEDDYGKDENERIFSKFVHNIFCFFNDNKSNYIKIPDDITEKEDRILYVQEKLRLFLSRPNYGKNIKDSFRLFSYY